MMTMRVVVLVFLLASTAEAQTDPRFSISLGAFFADLDSRTRLDGESGSGTKVELEDDLGLDRSDTVFRAEAYWRFADKHRIDVSGFDLSRSASRTIDRDIDWGDTTYPAGSLVDTSLDLTIYKAAYTWEFLKSGRSFLGATAGLYVMDVGVSFAVDELASRESNDLTAPLPVLGLRGEYRFSDRWSFRASGEVFFIEYGDYDGSLFDVFAGLDFSVTDNVAIGVGLNSVKIDVGVDKDSFDGDLEWRYDGALAYLKFDF